MARARDKRLAQLAADALHTACAAGLDRDTLRAWVAVCALVEKKLVQSRIDLASARALGLGEIAAARLAAMGDAAKSPKLVEEFAARDPDGLAGQFAARLGDMVQRFGDGSAPDIANASAAELFAWCLSQAARPSRSRKTMRSQSRGDTAEQAHSAPQPSPAPRGIAE